MEKQATFNTIKNECLAWHSENRDNIWKFFWQLREDTVTYSPSLGIAVLWCEWKAGDEIVDRTFEVVPGLTPKLLAEHVKGLGELGYGDWATWATDILADFDHYTFDISDEGEVVACVQVLAAICAAPDWTSDPEFAIQ